MRHDTSTWLDVTGFLADYASLIRPTDLLPCLHPVMADAPFAAVGIAEQPRGGEEEPAPAPHPQSSVAAIDLAEHRLDLVAMGVEIGEPGRRGALVMRTAPAPFLLDLEQIGILPDQVMARHHPAGEEMLRDPVIAIGGIEQIGAGAMGEDVHEEAAIRLQP